MDKSEEMAELWVASVNFGEPCYPLLEGPLDEESKMLQNKQDNIEYWVQISIFFALTLIAVLFAYVVMENRMMPVILAIPPNFLTIFVFLYAFRDKRPYVRYERPGALSIELYKKFLKRKIWRKKIIIAGFVASCIIDVCAIVLSSLP